MSAVDAGENERQRRRFLRRLYAATDGNYSAARAVDTIASDVGLGTKEGYRIARHLAGRGHLRWRASGVVSVTPAGAKGVEQETKAERGRRLTHLIRNGDVAAIRAELDRMCDTVTADCEDAFTTACAVLETTLRTYIAAGNLALPPDQSVRDLWRVVRRDLSRAPTPLPEDDLKRMLRGLSSVVDGVAAFRHAGGAHAPGAEDRAIEPVYARLAIRAACTVVMFILETWTASEGAKP